MTNRIPLIVNAGAGQIQEVSSTDVLQVPGNLTANVVQTDNYQYANGTPISFSGTYGNSNVAAYLPTYTGNLTGLNYVLADTIAANANVVANNIISTTETVSGNLRAGNLSAVGNVVAAGVKTNNYMYANGDPFVSSNYGDSNVQTLLNGGTFTGDIIPAANVTQSLGNSTNQWLDLWVSNATIYLNSIPLGVGNTGALQFDGNDIVVSGPNVLNTGNVETTGNIVGGNLATGDRLSFADGSWQSTAFVGIAETAKGLSNIGNAYVNSNGYLWNFNDSGGLYFPRDTSNTSTDPYLEIGGGAEPSIVSTDVSLAGPANLNIVANYINFSASTAEISIHPDDGTIIADTGITLTSNANGNTYSWTFGDDGRLTLPNNGVINTSDVAVDIGSDSSISLEATSVVNIYTDTAGAGYQWQFGDDGNLTAPGAITTTGNIEAGYFIGNGSLLTNLTGANVTGEVAVANTVSNPNQPNITALGTITSLTANAINVNGLFTANGNAQFNQDVYFAGNVTIPGNITQISGNSGQFFGNVITGFGALYAGLPAGYTLLNNEVVQFSDSYDGYTQVSHRNINPGNQATTDYVATANNGDDTTNYVDLGVAGSGYDGLLANNSLGTSLYANDSYLYAKGNVSGGNLVLGSNQANGVVRIIANGASNIGDVVATFGAAGLSVNGIVSATGNVTGGNVRTAGLVSATGNVTAGNVNTAIVSATGTVQAGNLRTTGLISATGNATAGNVITAGRVSATGNVYGGNVFAIAPAGASFNVGDYFSNGTIVTLDYIGIGQASFLVGSTIRITDGVEVPGLDGTYVVTAASADQCSFLNNTVASTGNVPTGFSNTFPTVTGVNSAVVSTTGNVVFGGYAVGDGSLLTNLPVQPGTYTDSNVATFLSAFGSNSISTTGNISATNLNLTTGGINQTPFQDLNITVQDGDNDGWSIYNTVGDGAGATLSQTRLQDGEFKITTDVSGSSYSWSFDNLGNLTLPGNTFAVNYANGTPVSISGGGGSGNSISNGNSNVAIATANGNAVVGFGGSDTFTFGTDGNLTLLHGGKIAEVTSPVPGNYALSLSTSGSSSDDQQLLVYPTFVDANHLHLTTGNLYNTELFLGNDDLYVKLANTGNVIINSNDNAGNTAQWTFDSTGNLTVPLNIIANGASPAPVLQNFTFDGFNGIISSLGTRFDISAKQSPTTGEGYDLDLSAGSGLGNIGGDVNITAGFGANSTGNGNITLNSGTDTWNFDNTGNLTLPGNTFAVNYANGTPVTFGGGSSVAEAPFSIQSADFTATIGSRYGIATGGGSVTATLPASPTTGQAVYFADAAGAYSTNAFIVSPNGGTIMGVSGSMTVTTDGQSFGLFFNGSTWRTYS